MEIRRGYVSEAQHREGKSETGRLRRGEELGWR